MTVHVCAIARYAQYVTNQHAGMQHAHTLDTFKIALQ